MLSIIGTIDDIIIINGLIKDNPIDNEIKLVFKIKRAYLHLFVIFLQFQIIFVKTLYIINEYIN